MTPAYEALAAWTREREIAAVNREVAFLLGPSFRVEEIPGTAHPLYGPAVVLYAGTTPVEVANNPQSMSTRIRRIARNRALRGAA